LFSKYLGETEKNIRDLFTKARGVSPCILFFDEMDVLGAKRDREEMRRGSTNSGGGVHERVLSQLLNEMDGIQEKRDVLVIACTSRLDRMDDALLRPGRFDQWIHVDLPTVEDRRAILELLSRKTPLASSVNLQEWSLLTEQFTGATIEMLFREAAFHALREDRNAHMVNQRHLQAAFRDMYPTKAAALF
jgi:transitional endoplasmic reticulum ATPase